MARLLALFSMGVVLVAFSSPLFAQGDAEDNYNKKCAICHGKDGSANTAKGKKLHTKDVHETMKDSAATMIKIVTDGKGDMDAYKDQFTADQIKALVEYYRSLAK
jgi:cytochrome c6